MLEAIKRIGDIVRKKDGEDGYKELCEDPNSNDKYKNIIYIVFKRDNENITFSEIDKVEYQKDKIFKYCFRDGSSRGTNCSPSAKVTEVEKTFQIKILAWFSKVLDKYANKLEKSELDLLRNVYSELEENRETILNTLKKIISETPKKEGSLFLTIRFDDEKEKKDLGDLRVFRKILQWESSLDSDKVLLKDNICSMCGNNTTVYGNVATYTFYTTDKPGFITGGFRKENAWKNYPVCSECAQSLEKGRDYVEKHFSYKFTGLPFYLIPKILSRDDKKLEEILDILVDDPKERIHHRISLSDPSMRSITNDEKYILEAIGGTTDQSYKLSDSISFHFLFLKKSSSAERIILHLEDVLPSRIDKILLSKDCVDSIFNKKYTFFDLRIFFSKSDPKNTEYDLTKYYLEVVEKIFKGNRIDINWFLGFLMKKTREEFINQEGKYFHNTFIRALKNILFLNNLQLIDMKEELMEESKLDSVFNKYGNTFKTPSKRGLFLLGSLTELLLRKQYSERRAKPFIKQLKGLKMNEKEFKGLLPKVQNKLEEYKSFDIGKKQLAENISNYLLNAGDNWGLTVDEMNFYFSAGMNLAKEVANLLYDKKQVDEFMQEEEENGSDQEQI